MATKQDLLKFVTSWTNGLSMIRSAYEKNGGHKEMALKFINKFMTRFLISSVANTQKILVLL